MNTKNCYLLMILLVLSACTQHKIASSENNRPEVVLQNANDSVSYAIGIGIANFYSQQGVKQLNTEILSKAISHVFSQNQLMLTEEEANNMIMNYLENIELEKAQPVIKSGEAFLMENKKRPAVQTTASGLQYEVIKKGDGKTPADTSTVLVHYKGNLITGEEFDNSYERGEPLSFKVNEVIKGWTEALQLMPAGSVYKLYIPHHLAYGVIDRHPIPGGSVLIFEVSLLEILDQ